MSLDVMKSRELLETYHKLDRKIGEEVALRADAGEEAPIRIQGPTVQQIREVCFQLVDRLSASFRASEAAIADIARSSGIDKNLQQYNQLCEKVLLVGDKDAIEKEALLKEKHYVAEETIGGVFADPDSQSLEDILNVLDSYIKGK
jgi:hypothetical protein